MIVVIGTGLAGYLFAKEFRARDQNTPLTLITASDGSFYSKPLLSTAFTQKKNIAALSIAEVASMRQQLSADIITHQQVTHLDRRHKKIIYGDHQSLSYHKLILAQGAEKIRLSCQGDAVSQIVSVNQLEEYRVFRDRLQGKKRVAIIGSGLVACEFANDLLNAGFSVTIVSKDQYLLQSLVPKIIGDALQNRLEKMGAVMYLNRVPQQMNMGRELILSDASVIQADVVLAAVGLQPNVSLAQAAHLTVNRGIVVNASLQTSHPDIYALGDCAEVMGEVKMYVAPIIQHARILAHVLTHDPKTVLHTVTPIIVKTPACPIVVVLPDKTVRGEWIIQADAHHIRALFYDAKNHLRGFALSGDYVSEKMQLTARVKECT